MRSDGVTPVTPEQAFDELYAACAPTLVRQTYLLTGRHGLALESVERAFRHAWHRWPEVALDPDPPSWVRAAAYEHALSPWRRLRRRHRRRERDPVASLASPADRSLLAALTALPPPSRRTLLLYDGLGLDLPETAAETEASTAAAAGRLRYAREAVAARLPELGDPDTLRQRMAETARSATSTTRPRPPRPSSVRRRAERVAWGWTGAVAGAAAVLGALTLGWPVTAANPPEPPVAEHERVRGGPVPGAPGGPSTSEGTPRTPRTKPERPPATGPTRVLPRAG
ncbi:RNA polymerase subunit sigma-70 [Streptomyces abyssomicinicus]|uniref:RNA polymerase subunit sigma-70 n=1 Tax=Streptomyces abyssomicinicus TaxID=574929 RepID=UPI00124FC2F5